MRLLVLSDPHNPLVPVNAILQVLSAFCEPNFLTFDQVGHRTQPNGRFELGPLCEKVKADSALWIEGGPLPAGWSSWDGHKACWLINSALEPTLFDDLTSHFDQVLSADRNLAMASPAKWLPLASRATQVTANPGLEILTADPIPPLHARTILKLRNIALDNQGISPGIRVCLGQGALPHRGIYDALAAGTVTVVDPDADLRDLAHPGDHLVQAPNWPDMSRFVLELIKDDTIRTRIARRAPDIVAHLHTPEIRAQQLVEFLQPSAQILGGANHEPIISVLVHCYRYLNRLKQFFKSVASQTLPAGSVEIVVADPQSPDGTSAYLKEFAHTNHQVRIVHVPCDQRYARNRGFCINRAFEASSGALIASMDGDLILPANLLNSVAEIAHKNPRRVLGIRRIFLNAEISGQILDGSIDPQSEFERLIQTTPDNEPNATVGVLGYCQIVDRNAFRKARYPEEFDQINQSDVVFNERLQRYCGVHPLFLADLAVLHLWHPRDWSGTKVNL